MLGMLVLGHFRAEDAVISSIISGQFVAFYIELRWERQIFFCNFIVLVSIHMFERRFNVIGLVGPVYLFDEIMFCLDSGVNIWYGVC